MDREEFEAIVVEHLEAIRDAWNQFLTDTAWEGERTPLCISVWDDSVSAFSLDEDRNYITNVYVKHDGDS